MFALRKSISLGRTLSSSSRCKHTLPQLPYAYDALQPIISKEIMELHHTKHHATYIANFNAAEEQLQDAISKNDSTKIIQLQPALRFNGGGHINHSIFWQNLSPSGGKPSADLSKAIDEAFGSFDALKTKLATQTVAIQGSGWGWLGYNPAFGRLELASCANQDPLQGTTGLIPLLGIDVWEHAYYLQYKNVRADYVKAIFDIVNWEDVSKRFASAKK
uniref:Superoxide dismutase n=1 Tax=Graphocephala atropunctata TaxID=36148 RepID=A0A1B6KIM9_9HEMI